MDEKIISIIVPIYNCGNYLVQCIESIINQTYQDLEIILMDDGSTDQSGVICDEYEKKDKRIKVIHQNNSGVSTARNNALKIAKGAYIGFVDADDWIDREMYSSMLRIMQKRNADVVICGVNYCTESGEYIRSALNREKVLNREELLGGLYSIPRSIGGGCCNKLFRRKKIIGQSFRKDIKIEEDVIYLFDCLEKCDLGYQMSGCFYNIRERSGSATRVLDNKKIYSDISGGRIFRIMYLKGVRYSKDMGIKATDKYLDECLTFANFIKKTGKETEKSYQWMYIKIKMRMLPVLLKAYIFRILPKEKTHGYIHDFFCG